jgi:DNA-binding transcriptional LysR family regulator
MNRLALMETFVRVLETGSFSAAARHLSVGQSAVSKSIAQLEDRLGVRLLMRSTHGLTPTEAGQIYYERARRVIDEADEADLAALGANACLTGRLRVSAGITLASLHLIPRLPAFLAAHPKLSIDLILSDRAIGLIEEGMDIGLRSGPLPDSSLIARRVATTRRLVLGAPDYFDRAGVPTAPAELIGHEAVIYTEDRGGSDTWTFRKDGLDTTVSISGRLRVSASEGVRAAVLSGMGLAIVSEWMFAPELACGEVRAVLDEWTLPAIDLWVVFPTGRMVSAKARAFAAFVENALKQAIIPDRNNPYEIGPAAGTRRRRLACASAVMALHA